MRYEVYWSHSISVRHRRDDYFCLKYKQAGVARNVQKSSVANGNKNWGEHIQTVSRLSRYSVWYTDFSGITKCYYNCYASCEQWYKLTVNFLTLSPLGDESQKDARLHIIHTEIHHVRDKCELKICGQWRPPSCHSFLQKYVFSRPVKPADSLRMSLIESSKCGRLWIMVKK